MGTKWYLWWVIPGGWSGEESIVKYSCPRGCFEYSSPQLHYSLSLWSWATHLMRCAVMGVCEVMIQGGLPSGHARYGLSVQANLQISPCRDGLLHRMFITQVHTGSCSRCFRNSLLIPMTTALLLVYIEKEISRFKEGLKQINRGICPRCEWVDPQRALLTFHRRASTASASFLLCPPPPCSVHTFVYNLLDVTYTLKGK